jgi:hypothetical protein
MFSLKRMLGIHQGRERIDVLVSLVLPGFLMLVSAYTNAWAFTGGNLAFGTWSQIINTTDAAFRGLFVEALVFVCFKLVKMLFASKDWRLYLGALIPGSVGLVAVIVSAGCGLSWVIESGKMNWMVHSIGAYLPAFMVSIFQVGMGLLFPVSLIVLTLYDLGNLIEEHIQRGIHLRGMAMRVQSAEHHQTMLLAAQKEANEDEEIKRSYKEMAQINARQAVDAARSGDYTFGLARMTESLSSPKQGKVTRISPDMSRPGLPTPPAPGLLSAPATPFAPTMPLNPNQSFINGQVTTNPPTTGMTQPIAYPPASNMPVQKGGFFGQAVNWLSGKN